MTGLPTPQPCLLDILFVFKVKLGTILPFGELGTFCQFPVVHIDLISNIFLRRYASLTLRIKL